MTSKIAGKRWIAFALVVLGSAALQGCAGKEAEQLRQQNDALSAKVTQLESRLAGTESQVGQLITELNQARAALEQVKNPSAKSTSRTKSGAVSVKGKKDIRRSR